jgi:hypothetical protein
MTVYTKHLQDATTGARRVAIETADSLAAARIIRRGGITKQTARTLRRSAKASKAAAALKVAQDCSGIRAALLRLEAALLEDAAKREEARAAECTRVVQPEHAWEHAEAAEVIARRAADKRLYARGLLQQFNDEMRSVPVSILFA